ARASRGWPRPPGAGSATPPADTRPAVRPHFDPRSGARRGSARRGLPYGYPGGGGPGPLQRREGRTMAGTQAELAEREQRLGEVVFAYLEAVANGQAPPREELLARHPDLAAELAEFLAERDRVDALAAPLREVARAARATPGPGDTAAPPDR